MKRLLFCIIAALGAKAFSQSSDADAIAFATKSGRTTGQAIACKMPTNEIQDFETAVVKRLRFFKPGSGNLTQAYNTAMRIAEREPVGTGEDGCFFVRMALIDGATPSDIEGKPILAGLPGIAQEQRFNIDVMTNVKDKDIVNVWINRGVKPELRDYLKNNPTRGLAVIYQSSEINDEIVCTAYVGLTTNTADNYNPRFPAVMLPGSAVVKKKGGTDQTSFCYELATMVAMIQYAKQNVETLTNYIEFTGTSTDRPKEKADRTKVTLRGVGLSKVEEGRLEYLIPKWIPDVFDYRQFAVFYTTSVSELPDRRQVCIASVSLVPRPAGKLIPRINLNDSTWFKLISRDSHNPYEDCQEDLFRNAINRYFGNGTNQDIERISNTLSAVREPDLPEVSLKSLLTAAAPWHKEQAKKEADYQKAVKAEIEKQRRLEKQNGDAVQSNQNCRPRSAEISCRSSCYNGDCEVIYENGCKISVQVQPKFNPFNNQWEFPSPPC